MNAKILKGWQPRVLIIFIMLFFSSNISSFAQPAYTYNHNIEDYGSEVWDVSGTFSENALGCDTDITLVQDETGKITGGGFVNCYVNGVLIDLDFDVMGNIRQKRIITAAGPAYVADGSLLLRFNGTATYLGRTMRCTATERITAEINPIDATMYGTVTAVACIPGGGCARETLSFTQPLDPGMDGSLNLDFEVAQDGWSLTGSDLAELTLSNGRTSYFSVRGSYNASRNESRFLFQGADLSIGCMLNITIDESTGDIIFLLGRVHGQSLNYRKP